MADKVPVLSPDGQFGTVDASDAEAVVRAGGRVLSQQEATQQRLQIEYDQKSLASKIGGFAATALPLPAQMALRGSGAVALPPELDAYRAGASQAFTLGAESMVTKAAVEAVAGKDAAKAYGQNLLDAKQAHQGWYTAGELAGFAGSAVAGGALGAAGKLVPGVGVSALGGVAEQGAARALSGLASRGAIGRALSTGTEFAARGAVEGALIGGAEQVSEAMLGDHELAADKLFAALGYGALGGAVGGGVIGGAGSLVASAGRAGVGAVGRALSRGTTAVEDAVSGAAARAEGAVKTAAKEGADAIAEAGARAESELRAGVAKATEEATAAARKTLDDAAASGRTIAEAAGVSPEKELSAFRKVLQGKGDDAARDAANGLAYQSLYAMPGLAKKINAKLGPDGTHAVGEYINRRILKVASEDASFVGSLTGGRADQLLPAIQADRASIGLAIGEKVTAVPVRVAVDDLVKPAMNLAKEMSADPTRIRGVKAFEQQIRETFEAFQNGGKLGADGTMDLAEAYYARAGMEKAAHELGQTSGAAAKDAFKEWLREFDGILVNKLDDAASKLGKAGVKDELLALKREYQLASWAERAASQGADRLQGNNPFGIREGIGAAVGLAMGSPLGAIATAVGGKVLRERGAAAGAYLLSRMADVGAVSRAMRAVDELVGRAAKGAISPPAAKKAAESFSSESVAVRANRAMQRIADIQADPAAYTERVTRSVEPLQPTTPQVAGAMVHRFASLAAFMSSKIPPKTNNDPLDPRPTPRLSQSEAHSLALYDWYSEKPTRFLEDLERGKVSREGVEVAKALIPGLFAEVQQRTLEGLAELMAKGKAPPYRQRERLGILLDIPAVPSQRPEHMRLLQSNVTPPPGQQQPKQGGGGPPRRPMSTKSQPSTLDRLEGQ